MVECYEIEYQAVKGRMDKALKKTAQEQGAELFLAEVDT